jgi:cyclopropane fatty-acyl-phospholipid synthase-like methyltransferase
MYKLLDSLKQDIKDLSIGDILEIKTRYKDIKSWVDIADHYYCKLLVPITLDKEYILIKLKKLNKQNSFHNDKQDKEKYGINTLFSKIDKNSKPSFLIHYLKALENVKIDTRLRILNLGINSGGEFEIIKQKSNNFTNQYLLGIDYSQTAIDKAKSKFNDKNIEFLTYDINNLDKLNLKPFDLIITIGTLQSGSLEFNKLFMSIVQNLLKKTGAIIIGFPNCRWIDDQMIYGASAKNYNFPEMSLLYKDVVFCKKYLQQKKFRVTITGKEYIFLTATSIVKY